MECYADNNSEIRNCHTCTLSVHWGIKVHYIEGTSIVLITLNIKTAGYSIFELLVLAFPVQADATLAKLESIIII